MALEIEGYNVKVACDGNGKEEKISSIPIFIHSSVANKENTIGAAGWIKKPADLGLILKAVKNYCS